jgi:hypothetical protein
MTSKSLNLLGSAALVAVAAMGFPASASAQTVNDEIRCVMVSNALVAGSKNPRGRQIGASVGAYFMGRLDFRPPAQVKAALVRQNRRIPGKEAEAVMNACAVRATKAEARLRSLAK